MTTTTGLPDNGYDDIVTFGRVLGRLWEYDGTRAVTQLLDYFEAPHKWESERQQWLALGGTLDDECLDSFENWYDNKDTGEAE